MSLLLLFAAAHARGAEDIEPQMVAGIEAFNHQNYAAAHSFFSGAQILAPERSGPYLWLGRTEQKQGQCAGAVLHLGTYLRIQIESGKTPATLKSDPKIVEASRILAECKKVLAPPTSTPAPLPSPSPARPLPPSPVPPLSHALPLISPVPPLRAAAPLPAAPSIGMPAIVPRSTAVALVEKPKLAEKPKQLKPPVPSLPAIKLPPAVPKEAVSMSPPVAKETPARRKKNFAIMLGVAGGAAAIAIGVGIGVALFVVDANQDRLAQTDLNPAWMQQSLSRAGERPTFGVSF